MKTNILYFYTLYCVDNLPSGLCCCSTNIHAHFEKCKQAASLTHTDKPTDSERFVCKLGFMGVSMDVANSYVTRPPCFYNSTLNINATSSVSVSLWDGQCHWSCWRASPTVIHPQLIDLHWTPCSVSSGMREFIHAAWKQEKKNLLPRSKNDT